VENDSSISHSKRRPVSVAALWLLPIGILLVEAALRLMPGGFLVRTLQLRMHEIVTLPAPKLQIMGDSVTEGIIAGNLAKALNLPVDQVGNYCLPGTSPMFAYFTLRRELAAGRVPGRILFAPHPANLEEPMVDRFMGRFATTTESLELLRHGVTLPVWLFGEACRDSVAMRNREEFRLAVTQGDFGFFTTLHKPAVSVLNSRIPVVQPLPGQPLAVNPADFPAQLSTPFSVDRVNAAYIDAFCDLAAAHGIRVTWVTVPVIDLYKERAMAAGGEAAYQAYLDGLVARHPNVSLLHRQLEVYPDTCFFDPWHLNHYGEDRFTAEVAAALKAAP
jgi:hypothetical protein